MVNAWGPLGWATLHSVTAMYSETPSELEKTLLTRWLDSFQKTIVCERCRSHFLELLTDYKRAYPNWNASRKDAVLFALRAHNTVNSKNGKPVYSAGECLSLLKTNIPSERASLMRQSYIVYVRKDWSRDTTMTGISAVKYIKELITLEQSFWSKRSFSWDEIVIDEHVNPLGPIPVQRQFQKPIAAYRFASLKLPKPRFSFLSG
jgi:hypothetical protein